MIEVASLRKTYGELVAVDDLSLRVAPGEVLALLGPNGAGKTTTVHCIVGVLVPDRGTITINGKDMVRDPVPAKRLVAYVPEVASLYESLTPHEYLTLRGRLFELPEDKIAAGIHRLLDGFGLLPRRHDPMVGFSKGMMQKVILAAALLTEPKVLVLDEPLSGLDVETTLVLKEILREFAERGGAVLYCSHLLDVVETVAHRIAILDQGKLVAVGTLEELRAGEGHEDQRLEGLFRELTAASDPAQKARTILG
ncbi:MAG: ABC transporter ATP-binding protein [Planctomycetota bacterium]|jgi:ABC-2 type transport system ATP-binding protein